MRLAPKQVQNQLDWTILDVEQEEWDQLMAKLGAAAAANGFPAYAATKAARVPGEEYTPTRHSLLCLQSSSPVVLASAIVLALAVFVGYTLWATAENGILHMQQDVANLVKLETVQMRTQWPALHLDESVQAVEFSDDTATAAVMTTRTLPSGQTLAQVQTRFYRHTPTGWQRTGPLRQFWGEPQTLDTAHLHFCFLSKDRDAVEQLAPAAEARYVALRHATGQTLTAAGGKLTVEILPERIVPGEEFMYGRLRMPSPLLFDLSYGYTSDELLSGLATKALASRLLDRSQRWSPAQPQWQLVVEGLRSWLLESDSQPLPSTRNCAAYDVQDGSYNALRRSGLYNALRLSDLLSCNSCTSTASHDAYILLSDPRVYEQRLRVMAARDIVYVIVSTYGVDVLPALLRGFSQYDDWETLAPPVLGVNAAELEAAWHACWPSVGAEGGVP